MKSNIKVIPNKPPKDEIILSIGMIIKNEEKHLEKCLSALKRFMDQISCELIIVDTGSTDRSKEIALKYTDKVYDFEWIDDFSAARNYGLKKAKGKWFMFLDADEYMDEDCSEMVSFFNMPELYERYNTASYIIRSYNNTVTKDAVDFLGSRLIKLTPDVEFHGKIHESLPYRVPHGYFGTVFHHYGYMNSDPNFIAKKKKRNLPLCMEHHEESPDDISIIGQVIDCLDDKTERLKYVEKGLEVIDKPENIPYVNAFLIRAMRVYMGLKKYDKSLEICDKFFEKENSETYVSKLSFYIGRYSNYVALEEYELAIENLEKYFEAYDEYKAGKLNILDLRLEAVEGCSEYEYEQYRLYYIDCLCKLKRFDEANKCMLQIDITAMQIPEIRTYLANFRVLLRNSRNYYSAAKLYETILKLNDTDKTGLVLYMLEEYYKEHEYQQRDFVSAMIMSGVEGPYTELMQLVRDSENGEDISEGLTDFIESVDNWKDGYSEAIYLAMKHNVDLSNVISKLGHDVLKSHFPIIAEAHSDYARVASSYCQNAELTGNIKSMLWMVSALETAVLTSQRLMAEERESLYDLFVCTLSDYIYNIYNPDLLNPEDADVLPELHRFGYYMTLAFVAKQNDDLIGYVRSLKEALRLCEPMKDLVSFYLSELEEEMKNNK